jgi:aspartyl protease family protein
MKTTYAILLLAALALPMIAQADMQVQGLFKGAVLLDIDGEQKLVKAGQSWKGVEVLEATSKQALARINGQLHTLLISTHISIHYEEPAATVVHIRKNQQLQYITTALINGFSVPVLVDTGANIVAFNARTARKLGVDYKQGVPSTISTASGQVRGYRVMLDSVDVGGLIARNVEASVLEGSHPQTVLLGISYLQHVEMHEKDGVLMLLRKY